MKQIYFVLLLLFGVQSGFANENPIAASATISGPSTICQNATGQVITFTGAGGTGTYTFTYTLNGNAQPPISTTSGSVVTLPIVTSATGQFTYNLVSVQDSSGIQNLTLAPVVVNVIPLPNLDFSFNNNNSCSGTSIQFTSLVTGGPYTYSWDFGDSSALSTQQNPIHSFVSLGCGIATFNVTLTITGGGGCIVSKTNVITVKQKPNINFIDVINPFSDPFNNCSGASSNPIYSITVGNDVSTTSSCITSFSINWGDGNSENNINFPISHTYPLIGAYSMVITAVGSNGCVNTKTYIIKNVSNPLGGLNSPGSTQNLCAPTANLQFSISNWGANSLDTTYSVDYGDGTPILLLTQNQLISSSYYNSGSPANSANYPIPHIYTASSCPAASYEVKLNVTNACGTTPFTLGNISILTKPTANFTAPLNGCINTNILFTNTTVAGYGQNCVLSSIYTWNFGDGTPIITTPLSPPQNISHTFTTPGTYTVTLTAQNFCGITTKTQQICIEPPLTPLFILSNTSGCAPFAITTNNTTSTANQCSPPTYNWQVTYASGNCGTTSNYTFTGGTNASSINPSFNFTESGTYTITLTATNSCAPPQTSTQTVTVKKPPTVTIASIPNACGSATITPTTNVTNCAPTGGALTYAWTFTGGIPATANTLNPGTITYPSGGPYSVTLQVTNECGVSNTATQSFSVGTAPTLTNTTLNQTICSGSQTTLVNLTANQPGTTFSWNATATAGITGFTPSGTTNTIPVQTISTTNANPGTVTYVITPTFNGCAGPTVNYVINVNPAPSITAQPASSSVCLNGSATILSVTLSNTSVTPTYQWYSNSSNSNSGGTLINGATSSTYNPPTNTPGTLYYYCVITLSSGGCFGLSTLAASVTVNPLPTITTHPLSTQNLCVGSTIPSALSIVSSGGIGTATYQWFSNTVNTTSGGTAISGATNATYTPPVFTVATTYYFYATVTLTGNGCGSVTSNIAEIVVFSDPIITAQPLVTQTLCQGATATNLEVTASGGNGSFTYQWYSNANNNTTSGTLISGATNATYNPPTTSVGTVYYYCIVSQATQGCSATSATAAVIINASPTILTQPQSSTVCSGGTPTVLSLTYSNGAGTPTYQWYSNTNNDTTSGTPISGETNPTYTPPANTVGIMYYYCLLTFPNITGSCATIATNTAAINVTAGATINQQPVISQNLCVGGTITTPLSVSYTGGTGTPSYQWYSNTSSSNTGGALINGAANANYTPPAFTSAGNAYYYVIISFSGSGCGTITSDVATVVVVDDPIITVQPTPTQTLCQNATANTLSVSVTGGIGGNYTYQWYVSSVNNTSSGTAIVGETNPMYIPTNNSPGTLYYYCIISQPNGAGCSVTSNISAITFNLAPAITNQPISSTICLGQSPNLLSFTITNGVGTPSYQWYSNTTNSNSGGTLLLGATNATYNPPAAVSGTTYYYCVVTFSAITGGCSVIATNATEVTINQNPVIASESLTICSGASFTVTPTNAGSNIVPTGTTYIWSAPTINPIGSITGATSETTPQTTISQTLINTTTSPATVVYTVTPTSGTCIGNNFTISVTVNPAINPNVVVNNNTCFGVNNASITTNITGGIPFTTGTPYVINWTGPNGFTSSAASIGNLAPGTYNVTINDAGGCPFSNSYTITEPTDIVITVDDENDITCFGSANGSINLTVSGGTGTYFYTWTHNGNPHATSEDISGLSPGTYVVSVTDANNCGPKTATFTITEPPLLVITLVNQTNVLCYGASTGAINVNVIGGNPGTGYNFFWTGPNTFTSSNQNVNAIPAGTYNLTVTDSNGCVKNLSVVITQSTEIIIAYTTTPITCYGANNASLTATISGGNAPYQYQWNNLATTLTQTNLSAGTYIITVTDNVGCIKTQTIIIPDAPVFTVNPIVVQVSCFGANNGSINLNLTGGIAPVALSWSDGSTSGLIRNNLAPGTYTATISDGTPCFIVRTFTIVQPQPLVAAVNISNPINCTNTNSGAIDLIVSGGTLPYSYSWSNGATTEDLSNLTSGNYAVTVTDAKGCTTTGQYTLIRPNPLQIAVNTQTTFNCTTHEVNQSFIAQGSGGVPPYNYQWSSGNVSGTNNEIMNSNTNGTVILTLTDSIGCTTTYSVNVDNLEIGYASFEPTSFGYTTYGIYSIGDPIQFNSTITGDYVSVSWDFGDGTFSTELNPEHTYLIPRDYVVTQTVTYPFGCVYVQTITLIVEKGYLLVVPTAFTPNNDTVNDTYRPVAKRLKEVQLDIYDTWGSLIYTEKGEVLVGWDGKIKGFNAENGNYYSKVTAETFYGTIVNENQTFVLIK
ncbi:PKD domain-containing protein [Flavobacterium sp. 102]|uniref:PKD domain-containing protein n=1 Tax=Flavobacterium sp. 102 TaxID=2135623 RepID=UPI000EB53224|nr:PKD domain-containing protein [Flavobacterium sp. 102]RKS00581.1 gliding motility-associated-like protein [Flavobacterium sp. 102]